MNTEIVIRDVRVDGFPDDETGVVFLFDGCWVTGWPLNGLETDDDGLLLWEANQDVGRSGKFYGVHYWTVLPRAVPANTNTEEAS